MHEMDNYSQKLEAFRQSDSARDALVAEVIQNYEDLRLAHQRKCDDYDNEVESRYLWQQKARTHEQALKAHRQASVRQILQEFEVTANRYRILIPSFWLFSTEMELSSQTNYTLWAKTAELRPPIAYTLRSRTLSEPPTQIRLLMTGMSSSRWS